VLRQEVSRLQPAASGRSPPQADSAQSLALAQGGSSACPGAEGDSAAGAKTPLEHVTGRPVSQADRWQQALATACLAGERAGKRRPREPVQHVSVHG